MKTLINISILFILLNVASYSQFYADSVISDYITEFWKIADEATTYQDDYRRINKAFSPEELEHIAKLFYKCYNDDPVGFQKYINEKHKEWEKAFLDVVTGKTRLKPWMKVYAISNQLSNKYGYKFISIIGTPAFIRGKYIELTFSTHILKGTSSQFRVHNSIFVVEEVLKGDKYFHSGDTISIDMIPNVESPAPSFITGKSYLIPVTTLLGYQADGFNTIFVYLSEQENAWVMGKPPKTFTIENKIIKNCEYFGIKDTAWTDFKKYFKESYLIFQ